jgi:hypothetical protein
MAPIFRMVCSPAALAAGPKGWTAEIMRDGEVAFVVDGGGLEAINAAAHALDIVTVSIVRSESSATVQEQTVRVFAGGLPLVWAAPEFSDSARTWARDRPPMTLLIEAGGAFADDERGRIGRFVAMLGRQTE